MATPTPEQLAALLEDPEFREKFVALLTKHLVWPGEDEIKKRLQPLLDAGPLPAGYYVKAGKPPIPY